MLQKLAALVIALFTVGANATTYTYAGGTYTAPITNGTTCAAPQSCGQFTTSQSLTGSFTTATPLPPNLSNQSILASITGYSFNNGVSSISQGTASRIDVFQVTTNASGTITSALISLSGWTYSPVGSPPAGPHVDGDRLDAIFINGASDSHAYINLWCPGPNVGNSLYGVADVCLSAGTDTASSIAHAGPGTWTTVVEPEPVITIAIANASIAEGNTGTASLTFNVTLSAAPTAPISVSWNTADGTATGGVDYVVGTGTLSWAVGDALTKTIIVQVNGDTTVEPDETMSVALSAPSGGTLAGTGTATGTILNDDVAVPEPLPSISIANASITEGNTSTASLTFNVTLSAAPTAPISVNWNTADGTATSGTDYVAGTGTLSWAVGDALTKTITVQVNSDTAVEPDETLSVALSAPTGATLAGAATATGTILNDDVEVVVPEPPPAPVATPVPTLSEWALVLLAFACAALGMRQWRRT